MKKLLFVLALGTFVACNSGTSTEEKVDSTTEAQKEVVDSTTEAKKDVLDSTAEAKKNALDSNAKVITDTTKH
jgi:hypothetical protein